MNMIKKLKYALKNQQERYDKMSGNEFFKPFGDVGIKLVPKDSDSIDISELYNLDITIAKFILPRLKEFKNNLFGIPYPLTKEEYNDILDKMIWSFDIISRGDHIIMDDNENDKKVQEGLDLFAKYLRNLWM